MVVHEAVLRLCKFSTIIMFYKFYEWCFLISSYIQRLINGDFCLIINLIYWVAYIYFCWWNVKEGNFERRSKYVSLAIVTSTRLFDIYIFSIIDKKYQTKNIWNWTLFSNQDHIVFVQNIIISFSKQPQQKYNTLEPKKNIWIKVDMALCIMISI